MLNSDLVFSFLKECLLPSSLEEVLEMRFESLDKERAREVLEALEDLRPTLELWLILGLLLSSLTLEPFRLSGL